MCRRLGLAEITDEDVDGICRRDSLALLGLTDLKGGAQALDGRFES
jgi:hypothetical protein